MRSISRIGAVVAAVLVTVAVTDQAMARSTRPSQIPNGEVRGCANCHVDPKGGGPRNPFGQMIESDFLTTGGYLGTVVWGPELAGLDADGDGVTNGTELGDPDGTWRAGDPDPVVAWDVTLPGDITSVPQIPTAVQASTWAAVKALIQQ